jgi:septal ring factor EnvC (AmiA/AmiB activator)
MIKIERKNGKPNCLYAEGGRRYSARQVEVMWVQLPAVRSVRIGWDPLTCLMDEKTTGVWPQVARLCRVRQARVLKALDDALFQAGRAMVFLAEAERDRDAAEDKARRMSDRCTEHAQQVRRTEKRLNKAELELDEKIDENIGLYERIDDLRHQVADLEAAKGERELLWGMGEQLQKITQRMERGQLFGPRLLWHLQDMADEMKGA